MSLASGAQTPPRRSSTFVVLNRLGSNVFDGHGLMVYDTTIQVVGR